MILCKLRDMEPRIRRMEPGDIPAVLSIEEESFSNPWRKEDFLFAIVSPDYEAVVAELEGPVGYAIYRFSGKEVHIGNLAVESSHRRKGVGSALLRHIFEQARRNGAVRATLEVRVSNEAARRFYLAHGFFCVAVRKGYYRKPREDALVMVKLLK